MAKRSTYDPKITGRAEQKFVRGPSDAKRSVAPKAQTADLVLTQDELRLCSFWQKEAKLSQASYDEWANIYKPAELEAYYRGDGQWPENQKGNYVCNLFYQSIEVRRPSLMFGIPKARLEPRPNRADDPGSLIVPRAKLLEDSANAQIQDPDFAFFEEINSCIHEHFFAFGVSECGYSADIVDNPNTEKPPMPEDEEEQEAQPEKIIARESLWVRRIPANMFRISLSGKKRLIANDWTGYFEWVALEDVKANPLYKGRTKGLRARATGLAGSFTTLVPSKFQQLMNNGQMSGANEFGTLVSGSQNMILLFKVWDHRKKVRHVFTGDFSRNLLPKEGKPWRVYPFNILRGPGEILDSGYPVPPTYNWRSPQDEINERSERNRIHGRRFNRKYMATERRVDPSEVEKLEVGADGTVIWVKGDANGAIVPLQDAMLDPRTNDPSAPKEDFIQVSGVGGEQRALASSETATQANIIEVNTKVRETVQREDVVKFLSGTVRTLCELIQEYWTTPMYIKTNVDLEALREGQPTAIQEAMDIAQLAPSFKQITPLDYGDRGDYLYEVSLSMEFLSPSTEDKDRQQLMALIALLSNPTMVPVLSASPEIFRRLLNSFGVKSEHDIREYSKILQGVGGAMAAAQVQQGAMSGGQSGQGGGTAQEGMLPNNDAIADQLAASGIVQ